jgi:hypothetical protein
MTPKVPRKGKYLIIKEKTRDKLIKASHLNLMHLILVLLNAPFINVYKNAWFYIAILSR